MVDAQIHVQPKGFLVGLRQRVLMSEKEMDSIDDHIVDLPQLKCVPYCFKQLRWCDRLDDGKQDPVKDGDMLKHWGTNPEIKKLIKKALAAWNYYLLFRNAKIWPIKDRESGFVSWGIKKSEIQYTEKDILKASLIKGMMLSVADKEMIGIVMNDGMKLRYLLDKSLLEVGN